LETIFREVFHDGLVLHAGLSACATEGWVSLRHITLIYAIEEEFGIEFTPDEIADLANVGELKVRIAGKLGVQPA
jgi:acyl carrier protein